MIESGILQNVLVCSSVPVPLGLKARRVLGCRTWKKSETNTFFPSQPQWLIRPRMETLSIKAHGFLNTECLNILQSLAIVYSYRAFQMFQACSCPCLGFGSSKPVVGVKPMRPFSAQMLQRVTIW